jgi:hypothetical protein
MAKSEMTFSPLIHNNIKNEFQTVLPFTITNTIAKYLRMPTQIGHSKQAAFNFIMDRLKTNSKGGKKDISPLLAGEPLSVLSFRPFLHTL